MSYGDTRMTHDYITEQDLVGRYMAGTLPNDERAQFEAHFVDCPRCLDALEDVEPFRTALRAVASDVHVPRKPSNARRLMQPLVGLAAAAVIALGIADAVRMRREVARVKTAADVSERERLNAEQRVRDVTSANAERAKQEDAAGALVFSLVKTRGTRGEAPQNRVTISTDAGWIVLLADLNTPAVSAVPSRFRATIDTAAGRRLWSNDRLSPSSADTVGVAVPSRLLSPGDYVLTVEEQPAASNGWRSVGHYTFRVASLVR